MPRGHRMLHWLRTLREDLGTVRPQPLPQSVHLRRLSYVVVCVIAFGILVGASLYLHDNVELAYGYAVPIGLTQSGAAVLALHRPVPAWWLSIGAAVVCAAVTHSAVGKEGLNFIWPWTPAGIVAHLLVLLLLALRVPTRAAVATLALTALATWAVQLLLGSTREQPVSVLVTSLSAAVVVLGVLVRSRRETRAELGRLTTLTAEEQARRMLLEERSRIARELHDVVAHHMSVISIQAQVAPHLVTEPPQELKENLAGIRQNALEALSELRLVLGVLRSEPSGEPANGPGTGPAPNAPQPTLDRLDALVDNTRAAGLTVSVEVTGERRPLPPGVELSAYRITQEALSNVLRHAPGATAGIRLEHTPAGLRLTVHNSPPQQPAPPSPGTGHGLLGMRERTAMLGGVLTTHRLPDGGYEVSAFLPADGKSTQRPTTSQETE
ncbi:sensor histidine kinase [Streptomyces albidoflavus]|uniref:sensor histidine kinase n=1 Tax=Streptomyces albidoflavus TaxID=1886 RepID=UPI00101E9CF0|nr:sensor histidine kinase [Streptomyces albidoflavus]RZD78281.1 two-component sensor histidine kinase [Streptomyces albidoflavus]